MNHTITATELADNLAEVLTKIRDRGDVYTVELDGEPVANLAPSVVKPALTLHEFLDRLLEMGDLDEEFAADVRAGIAAQGPARIVDWPSRSIPVLRSTSSVDANRSSLCKDVSRGPR